MNFENLKAEDIIGNSFPAEGADGADGGQEPGAEGQQNPDGSNDPAPGAEGQQGQQEGQPGGEENPDAGAQGSEGAEGEGSEESLYNSLQTQLGIEVEGEFEDSIEGMVNFTSKAAEKMAQSLIQQQLSQMPDVLEYMRYRQQGGEPDRYFKASYPDQDYSNLEIKETDTGTQRDLIRNLLSKQGFSEQEINETVTDYSEAGILYKQAKIAQGRLSAMQKTEKEQLLQEQAEQAQRQEQEAVETWKQIGSLIEKGNISGIAIPQTERTKFFEWMAKPIDQSGKSQREIAKEKMNLEDSLMLEYLIYKGMKISDLVTATNKSKGASALSARLGKKGTGARMSTGNPGSANPGVVKLPSLNDIF